MGGAIELPGGMRIEPQDPVATALVAVAGRLDIVIQQLDVLVKLECGAIKREDFKRMIEDRELAAARAAKAAANGGASG